MSERGARANTDPLAVIGMNILSEACDGLQAFEKKLYRGLKWKRADRANGGEGSGGSARAKKSSLLRVAEGIQEAAETIIPASNPGICYWSRTGLPVADLAGLNPGPAGMVVDLSSQRNPLLAGYAQAKSWFEEGKCQTVLLACSDGAQIAAAVVLQPLEEAQGANRQVYAIIEGVFPLLDPNDLAQSLQNAGVAAREIGYLELNGFGDPADLAKQVEGPAGAFKGEINDLTTVLRIDPDQGEETPVDPMASLIRTCLCLYHRFLPASPDHLSEAVLEELIETGFYQLEVARPWLLNWAQRERQAGLCQTGMNGAFWLLEEDVNQKERPNPTLVHAEYRLFPLAANTLEELNGMVKLLRIQAEKDSDLVALSQKWFTVYQKRPAATIGLMLTGTTQAELLREIEFAQKGIPDAMQKGNDWQTPSGSYFTPKPLGRNGGVCLVYPGAFNSYVGIGRDLFQLFPQIFDWMEPLAKDLAYVFCDHYLYPRSLGPISKEELNALETGLTEDAVAMMTSGMAFSVVYTYILERVFKVTVDSALGYSLGEMSMLFATGVWEDGDKASEALARSPLFSDRLAGPLNAVREAWGMKSQPDGRSEDLWANHVLMAAPDRVAEAIKGEKRVYMTHTNTPRQVVIGGEKNDCQRVIQALKCSSLKAPFSYALHCDAMKSEYEQLRELNLHPIQHWPDLRLYSAAGYDLFKPDPEDIAHQVAISLCNHLDFPRLVQRAYADGDRIFIEVGAGGNCAKWIDDSLRGQPCLTMSVNRKGMDDAATLVRTLAKLASHRVPVDLAPLYQ
jgi:PfaB family protein